MMFRPSPESKPANPSPLQPVLKEEPALSDLNPLFNAVELHVPSSVEAFNFVTSRLIARYGGLRPDVLKAIVVPNDDPNGPAVYRYIARFEVGSLTEKKIHYLEDLVKYTYGFSAQTRKSSDGVALPAVRYPPADRRSVDEILNTRLEGWYMGPNSTPLTSHHMGVYLFRDVGVTNTRNFLKDTQAKRPRYVVEIREARLFETDLANLIVETATILGKGRPIDYGQLMYDTYYELMRGSLKKEEEGYELDRILRPVMRGLILPLANPKLADALTQEPESVLLAGVPGTGKSLAARKLLTQDTGVFIVPMDPLHLVRDIQQPPEKRELLPRISHIRSLSQRPVVLQLDDVEKLFDKDNSTSSTFLNLMAGVQDQGFYVLASTNEPEQIDVALLQPQRLGIRVYCGLPGEQARFNILQMHTPISTPNGAPLFSPPGVREIVLKYIAEKTESFPPRQLGEITTQAKSVLLERVSVQRGKVQGLTEEDLNGETYTLEDWVEALYRTSEQFDLKSTIKRDEEIRDFLVHHERRRVGYAVASEGHGDSFEKVRREIAAIAAQVSAQEISAQKTPSSN